MEKSSRVKARNNNKKKIFKISICKRNILANWVIIINITNLYKVKITQSEIWITSRGLFYSTIIWLYCFLMQNEVYAADTSSHKTFRTLCHKATCCPVYFSQTHLNSSLLFFLFLHSCLTSSFLTPFSHLHSHLFPPTLP